MKGLNTFMKFPALKSTFSKVAIGGLIIVGVIANISELSNTYTTARNKAQVQSKINEKQDVLNRKEAVKRLTAISKVINDSGGIMEVKDSKIKITLPGAVSEYEAQRIAKMVADRTGTSHYVEVYDNAGLKRASIGGFF